MTVGAHGGGRSRGRRASTVDRGHAAAFARSASSAAGSCSTRDDRRPPQPAAASASTPLPAPQSHRAPRAAARVRAAARGTSGSWRGRRRRTPRRGRPARRARPGRDGAGAHGGRTRRPRGRPCRSTGRRWACQRRSQPGAARVRCDREQRVPERGAQRLLGRQRARRAVRARTRRTRRPVALLQAPPGRARAGRPARAPPPRGVRARRSRRAPPRSARSGTRQPASTRLSLAIMPSSERTFSSVIVSGQPLEQVALLAREPPGHRDVDHDAQVAGAPTAQRRQPAAAQHQGLPRLRAGGHVERHVAVERRHLHRRAERGAAARARR